MLTPLEYALDYQKRGLFVLTIKPKSKQPQIRWAHRRDRRPSPDEIREWWKRWPDSRVGLATGACSGFDVLDVDGPRHAKS